MEKKPNGILWVMANEQRKAQYLNWWAMLLLCHQIVDRGGATNWNSCEIILERLTGEGESPASHLSGQCAEPTVHESHSLGLECQLGGRLHPELKTCLRPIANKYHEGKMKRTLERELKVPEVTEWETNGINDYWHEIGSYFVGWPLYCTCGGSSLQMCELLLVLITCVSWTLILECGLLVIILNVWTDIVLCNRSWAEESVPLRQSDVSFLTRLETRTKESKIHASLLFVKHVSTMKVTAGTPAPATNYSAESGLSVGMLFRTRKMVNYAWVGWSHGKPCWRLVSILTCKSFVKPVYRGERLIELSSSWFLSKFPSG